MVLLWGIVMASVFILFTLFPIIRRSNEFLTVALERAKAKDWGSRRIAATHWNSWRWYSVSWQHNSDNSVFHWGNNYRRHCPTYELLLYGLDGCWMDAMLLPLVVVVVVNAGMRCVHVEHLEQWTSFFSRQWKKYYKFHITISGVTYSGFIK